MGIIINRHYQKSLMDAVTCREIFMSDKLTGDISETVEKLLTVVPSVHESTCCLDVLEMFHGNKKLYALPVVNDKDRPVGIVVRHDATEVFSKLFVKELKGKKSIATLMDTKPIIVDRSTSIDDVARIIVDTGMEHMVSGFIITKEKRYFGMANGYDLLSEITRRKQNYLFGLAHYDQLTGLPNRTLLRDRLLQGISIAGRTSRAISLLYIDLDGFKQANDTYGHALGDHLLKEVAARLLTCLREGDTAARLGGDEFVVVLLESEIDSAITVAKRILETLRAPYELGKKTISSISASIGIAEYPEHADELDALLTAADNAMYVAKENGKNQYAVFTPQG
jgi:diguanylate cyclase (GGDEF)-like protein